MVDVGDKPVTERRATAEAFIRVSRRGATARRDGRLEEGQPARDRAHRRHPGRQAHLRSDPAVPSARALVAWTSTVTPARGGYRVTATVRVAGKTGVEMEALTAVSVAALTIYDMLKAADRAMTIERVRLVEKTGGRSGHYRAR